MSSFLPIVPHLRLTSSRPSYFGIKYGAGSMEKNPSVEGKSIVNISSGAGMIGGTGIGYTATKVGCIDLRDLVPP